MDVPIVLLKFNSLMGITLCQVIYLFMDVPHSAYSPIVHFPLASAILHLKFALLELTRNVFPQQY